MHAQLYCNRLLTHKEPCKPPLKQRVACKGDISHDKQQTHTAQTDRLSTETTARTELRICNSYNCLASLGVVHPVQNDLRRPVPTGHHVARHLSIGAAGQPKVQDLHRKQTHHNTTQNRCL